MVRTTHTITHHQSAEDLKFCQCCCEHLRCFTFINMCTQKGSLEFWSLHVTCLLFWFVLLVEMWFALEVFFGIKFYLKCVFEFFIHPSILWLERVWWHLDDKFLNQGEIAWCCLLTLRVSNCILDMFYE